MPNGYDNDAPPRHDAVTELYLVDVVDAQTPALAGTADTFDTSPPQQAAEALRLVRVLIGSRETPAPAASPWRGGIAGGIRIVTLLNVADSAAGEHGG